MPLVRGTDSDGALSAGMVAGGLLMAYQLRGLGIFALNDCCLGTCGHSNHLHAHVFGNLAIDATAGMTGSIMLEDDPWLS